jgi:hypothetical protein
MAIAQGSAYSRSYNSFGGADIKAVFGNKVIGELQAISYSITREKAPIYTMGSADPRSYARGKRGIAGTMVFVNFDREALLSTLGGLSPDGGLLFQSDKDDIKPDYRTGGLSGVPRPVQFSESPLDAGPASDQELASAWYLDQIPPFDVTLAAANEYGALAVMKILGVECVNEGFGISVDDIVSEKQVTYVARQIIGWTPIPSLALEKIAAQSSTGG